MIQKTLHWPSLRNETNCHNQKDGALTTCLWSKYDCRDLKDVALPQVKGGKTEEQRLKDNTFESKVCYFMAVLSVKKPL